MPKAPATQSVTLSKPELLHAVSLHISQEETRYYLNGLWIEPVSKGILLVATDGHRLSVGYDDAATHTGIGKGIILPVPKAMHRDLNPRKFPADKDIAPLQWQDGWWKVIDRQHGAPAIDGNFPDWRRVLPPTEHLTLGMKGGFNTRYLAELHQIAKILQGDPEGLLIYGEDAAGPHLAQITNRSDWRCILMPMWCEKNPVPDWLAKDWPKTWANSKRATDVAKAKKPARTRTKKPEPAKAA